MKLKTNEINGFLNKMPASDLLVVLIYGPDYGLVRERMKRIASHIVESLDDPFQVAGFEDSQLAKEPSNLSDEAAQISFMGGRRIILVRNGDKGSIKAVNLLLNSKGEALTLITAGDLKPDHGLRKLCESNPHCIALPCYLDDPAALSELIDSVFRQDKIMIESSARQYLIQHLGSDHGLSRSEVEKLALYAGEGGKIGLDDVRAALGDSADFQISDSLNFALEGNWRETDHALEELFALGFGPIPILRALAAQLIRLQEIRAAMRSGISAQQAVKTLFPRLFFKLVSRLEKQANIWKEADLNKALMQCLEAEAKCKQSNQPDHALVSRILMRLANSVRA